MSAPSPSIDLADLSVAAVSRPGSVDERSGSIAVAEAVSTEYVLKAPVPKKPTPVLGIGLIAPSPFAPQSSTPRTNSPRQSGVYSPSLESIVVYDSPPVLGEVEPPGRCESLHNL